MTDCKQQGKPAVEWARIVEAVREEERQFSHRVYALLVLAVFLALAIGAFAAPAR